MTDLGSGRRRGIERPDYEWRCVSRNPERGVRLFDLFGRGAIRSRISAFLPVRIRASAAQGSIGGDHYHRFVRPHLRYDLTMAPSR
jgi:hypothetical protein